MLTTEAYPDGLWTGKRLEVVTAECAFGMNVVKDLFAGVRDIVGGRSVAVQKTLRDSWRVAGTDQQSSRRARRDHRGRDAA